MLRHLRKSERDEKEASTESPLSANARISLFVVKRIAAKEPRQIYQKHEKLIRSSIDAFF